MKKIFFGLVFCLSFLLLGNFSADAQRYQNRNNTEDQYDENEQVATDPADSSKFKQFLKKLTFGGNFSLQFGDVTFIDISPLVGYRVTDDFTVGVGGTYNYIGLRYTSYGQKYKEEYSLYGGRTFAQYAFFKNFFAHAEMEALNVPDWSITKGNDIRAWITAPLLGGGYRSQIGQRAYFNITALYNLKFAQNQDVFPMYSSPLILRIGFSL